MTSKRRIDTSSNLDKGLLALYLVLVAALFVLPKPYSSLSLAALLIVGVIANQRAQIQALDPAKSHRRLPLRHLSLRRLSPLFGVLVLGSMVYAVFLFNIGTPESAKNGLNWFIGSLFAFGLILTLQPEHQPPRTPSVSAPDAIRRMRWFPLVAGVVLLAILTEINAGFFSISFLDTATSHGQFVLLVAGVILVGWGLSGRATERTNAPDQAPSLPLSIGHFLRREWPILFIMAIAVTVRFWHIGSVVPMFIDEL